MLWELVQNLWQDSIPNDVLQEDHQACGMMLNLGSVIFHKNMQIYPSILSSLYLFSVLLVLVLFVSLCVSLSLFLYFFHTVEVWE